MRKHQLDCVGNVFRMSRQECSGRDIWKIINAEREKSFIKYLPHDKTFAIA